MVNAVVCFCGGNVEITVPIKLPRHIDLDHRDNVQGERRTWRYYYINYLWGETPEQEGLDMEDVWDLLYLFGQKVDVEAEPEDWTSEEECGRPLRILHPAQPWQEQLAEE